MDVRKVEGRQTRGRDTLTGTALVTTSLLASVAWLLLHDRSHASSLGTVVVVALPIAGLVHAFWRSIGLTTILANAFALFVALVVALLLTISWPGPAV
jgi:hypothetical protein